MYYGYLPDFYSSHKNCKDSSCLKQFGGKLIFANKRAMWEMGITTVYIDLTKQVNYSGAGPEEIARSSTIATSAIRDLSRMALFQIATRLNRENQNQYYIFK